MSNVEEQKAPEVAHETKLDVESPPEINPGAIIIAEHDVQPYQRYRDEMSRKKSKRVKKEKVGKFVKAFKYFSSCFRGKSKGIPQIQFEEAKDMFINSHNALEEAIHSAFQKNTQLQVDCEREMKLLRKECHDAVEDMQQEVEATKQDCERKVKSLRKECQDQVEGMQQKVDAMQQDCEREVKAIADEFYRSVQKFKQLVKETQDDLRSVTSANDVVSNSLATRLIELENGLKESCFLKFCMQDHALPETLPEFESPQLQQARHVIHSIRCRQ